MKKTLLLLALFAAVAQSCLEPEDPNAEQQDLLEKQSFKISQYLADNSLTAEKDDKSIYRIALEENPDGEAIEKGDVARVNYKITQLDGTLIGEGENMRLAYEQSATIIPRVLYYALEYMKEGETYRFYVPSGYAYGDYSLNELIPHRSIVVLELEVEEVYQTKEELFLAELAAIDSVIADGEVGATDTLSTGIRKVLLEEGSGEMVDSKDMVSVLYTGYFLDGEVFDTNTKPGDPVLNFTIGGGQTIPGFETAVKSMKKGEKAIFYLPSEQAYGKSGWFIAPDAVRTDLLQDQAYRHLWREINRIPPYSPIVFEVELIEVTKK